MDNRVFCTATDASPAPCCMRGLDDEMLSNFRQHSHKNSAHGAGLASVAVLKTRTSRHSGFDTSNMAGSAGGSERVLPMPKFIPTGLTVECSLCAFFAEKFEH